MDDATKPNICEADSAFLEFNWHQGEARKTTVIEVVQLNVLYERMAKIVAWDESLETKLHELRIASKAGHLEPDETK